MLQNAFLQSLTPRQNKLERLLLAIFLGLVSYWIKTQTLPKWSITLQGLAPGDNAIKLFVHNLKTFVLS